MANEQNLIPLTNRSKEDAKRIRSLGGKAHKGLKKYKITTCKSCKLPCPLKQDGTVKGWKCKVPDAKKLILEAFANPNKLTESLFMDAMELQTLAGKDFKKKKDVFYAKLDLKKEVNPSAKKLEVSDTTEYGLADAYRDVMLEEKKKKDVKQKRSTKRGGKKKRRKSPSENKV